MQVIGSQKWRGSVWPEIVEELGEEVGLSVREDLNRLTELE